MNLLAHHLKKDIRHLRWLLALWFLLVLSEALLIGFGARAAPDDTAAQIAYQMINFILPMLQFLLVVVIVPMLVHDEPLVGSTAFWFTRPIARRLLLTSKALFLCVGFVLFPVAVELAVIAANGVPARDIALVAPELLFDALKVLVCIAALSALTLNFARFAITGVAIYIGIVLVAVAVQLGQLFLDGPDEWGERSMSLALSRGLVSGLLLILGGLLVIVWQYLTRRTRVSIGIAAAGLLLVGAVGWLWPWDFMRLPDRPPADSAVDCSALSAQVDNRFVHVSSRSAGRRAKEPLQRIRTTLKIEGLPPAHDTRVLEIRTRFTAEGITPVDSTNRGARYYGTGRWDRETLQQLFPDRKIIGPSIGYSSHEELVTLPLRMHMELMNVKGTLEGQVDIAVDRWVVDHVFPLQAGSQLRRGSTEEIIAEVRKTPGGALVVLRRTALTRRYVRQHGDFNTVMESRFEDDALYVLHNKSHGEIVMPNTDNNFDFDIAGSMRRLNVKPQLLRYPADNLREQEAPILDDEWLAGAELIRIRRNREGVCTLPLRKENFSLKEKTSRRSDES